MLKFLGEMQSKLEPAHTTIDTLINADDIKNAIRNFTKLQDSYKFGSQGRVGLGNNLINSLVDINNPLNDSYKQNFGNVAQAGLSMELGKNRNLLAELMANKGGLQFNLSGKF